MAAAQTNAGGGSAPATQGLGTLGVADVILDGKKVTDDVSDSLSDITINRTIDGASTLTLVLNDTSRKILRSGIFDHRVRLTLDGLDFVLVEPAKQQDVLSLTFEDAAVSALRQVSGRVTAAAGTTTRSGFAERLVRPIQGVTIKAYPDPNKTLEPLSRGTSSAPNENTWRCLTRLANEVQWRCFSDGSTIWFGPDSWLMSFPVLGTLREFHNGVDNIDFDYDVGKPLTSITVTLPAHLWAFPPGSPVALADMGVVNGTYLVSLLTRSLFVSTATVSLTAPQKALPEPTGTAVDGSTIIDGGKTPPNAAAGIIVATAESQLGVPYQWGGEAAGKDFDCSGLTQFCCRAAGISIPRTAAEQYAAGPKVNGALLPGDLVFFVGSDGTTKNPGHVGICLGGGKMIDAPFTGAVVRVDTIADIGNYVGATRPAA
jgi:cell wall-associated NlpC family hydrolase